MKHVLSFLALFAVLLVAAVALAADLSPDEVAMVDALEAALVKPISWQVLGGALGALALWCVRYWQAIAEIDTKKEALALAAAVGTPSAAALMTGSHWTIVLVGAVASFMAFVKLNSGVAGQTGPKPEAGRSDS